MALISLRLRRTLTITSSLLKTHHRNFTSLSSPPNISSSFYLQNYLKTQVACFKTSLPLQSSARYGNNNNNNNRNGEEALDPNAVLFEGCDYNHWLITMDFPKDPKPTPEEMVETYVQTCAKVVGSVEEAKKRIYACSTTTYQGFQVMVSEEMSEKFQGLPGVVFILPDSYIDPPNKEYGGDKYENGIITHRPPPVQYRSGRYGDRNRSNDRPPMQPRNQSYDHQGSAQGDRRNYAPQQNYGSRENFGPGPAGPGVGRSSGVQQKYPPQQNFAPSPAAPGDGRNYVAQQNYPPQQNFSSTPAGPGDGRGTGVQPNSVPQSYIPQQNYGPVPVGQQTGGRETYQAERREPMPSYQRDFPQAGRGDNMPTENRDLRGDSRNFGPAAGDYRQGAASSYSQSYPGPGEGQRFSQMEQRDGMQGGEQRNFNPPMGQMRNDQGQY